MSDEAKQWSPQYESGPNEMSDAAMAYHQTGDQGAPKLFGFVHGLLPVQSVVDFGTGRGTWLLAAMRHGISDMRGYDIPGAPADQLRFPTEHFVEADLGRAIDAGRTFDLAISTEVAEHIEPAHAAQFIANIVAASDLVLFSAAIPYQGGVGHQNELWAEYWAKRFAAHGFGCYDILRHRFWHDGSVRSYYRQNLFLFARGTKAEALNARGFAPTDQPLSLVHPEQYLKVIGRALPPELSRIGPDVRQYYDCVTRTPDQVDASEERLAYGKERVGWAGIMDHFGF